MARPSLARSTTYDSGNSFLSSHTLASGFNASGTDGVLVVVIHQRNPITEVTSVTADAVAMTLEASNVNTNVSGVQIYYYVVNDASVDIVANTPSFKLCAATVMYWENVDSTTPITQTWNPGSGFSQDATSSITADDGYTSVISALNFKDDRTLTESGVTTVSDFAPSSSNLGQAAVGRTNPTGYSQTLGWTVATSNNWSLLHAELKSSDAGFTYIQSKNTGTITASSITATLDSATTQGNLIVVNIRQFLNDTVSITSVTDNAGNSYALANQVKIAANRDVRVAQYYGVQVTGGATTVTVNYSASASTRIAVDEFSGNNDSNSNVLDTTATDHSFIGTFGDVSASNLPGGLAVAGYGFDVDTSAHVAGTGYTITNTNARLVTQYKLDTGPSEEAPMTWTTTAGRGIVVGFYKPLEEVSAGDDYTISPNDISIGATIDSTTITQNHVITPQDINIATTTDNVTITQNHVIVPQDIAISTTTDNTTVEQSYIIAPDDITISTTTDNTTITQNHIIATNDIQVNSSIDATSVTESTVIIQPNDIAISASIDATTITQNHIIATNDIAIATTTDATTITQIHIIQPADITVSTSLDATTLAQSHVITSNDIFINSSLDNATIAQNHVISTNDMAISSSIDATTIEVGLIVISPDDITITTSTDNTTISQLHVIATNDILIGTKTDSTSVGIIGLRYYKTTNITITQPTSSISTKQSTSSVRVTKERNIPIKVVRNSDNIRIVKQNTVIQ